MPPKEQQPPSNWPRDVHYTQTCSYHASVSHDTRTFLQGNAKAMLAEQPSSLWSTWSIRIQIKPAPTARKIPPKTHIVDYIGEIHCDEREGSDYDLSLFRQGDLSIGIDASRMGNEGRFVNDYRGVPGQDRPNAIFVDVRTPSGELKMRIQSSRMIKKGEEILVSYGKTWWRARNL